MQSPNHFEIGATYRHEPSGFVGVAQKPDHPQELKVYRLEDGSMAASIGPVFGDPDAWTVQYVEATGDEHPDGGPVYVAAGDPVAVNRARLPLNYPRVGLQCEAGPKGAPERRYFDADDLELVEG